MSNLPIAAMPPAEQFEALKKSRLAQLIQDKGLLSKICEAAVHLLSDPKIQECDEASILGALYKAATMGFRLERDFGECHLIPRSLKVGDKWVKTCSFQIGYKGWKSIALQSGNLHYLEAREVYTADTFKFKHGTAAFLDHEPAATNDGKMSHFYALCKLKSGEYVFSVINIQEAEKSRRNSETQYKDKVYSPVPVGVWLKNYAQMALRVPIKRLCAALPMTAAIETALQSDGGVTYVQKDGTVTTIQPADVESQAEQFEAKPLAIPANIERQYFDNEGALSTYTDFPEVLELWKKQDANTPQMMFQPYLKLFFDAAARTATTSTELNAFYAATPSAWQKSEKLMAILSAKSKSFQNAKPA